MSGEPPVSEEMLGAFVDGELAPADWAAVEAQLRRDPALREQACRLRAVKDLLRHAHPLPARPPQAPARRWARPVALACAALALVAAGWTGRALWTPPAALDAASAYALRGDWRGLRGDWGALAGGKVLVHVSAGGHDALAASLDEVEDLLRAARAGSRDLQVEIVANGPGLDLLRAGQGSFEARLARLRGEFPGLSLVACGQTVERRRAAGHPLELVPGATVAPSALHEVVERLRAGWVYVRA